MKSLTNRLDRIEQELIPEDKLGIMFIRELCQEEDYAKQLEEYERLHGNKGKVTFFLLMDFAFEGTEKEPYETFIDRRRRECGKGNCFVWWPELSPEETDLSKVSLCDFSGSL